MAFAYLSLSRNYWQIFEKLIFELVQLKEGNGMQYVSTYNYGYIYNGLLRMSTFQMILQIHAIGTKFGYN